MLACSFTSGTVMENIALSGIDLGKHIFHVHAQDKAGHQLWRRKLNRKQLIELVANTPACRIVMATSSLPMTGIA